jgi:hypothetical protein
MVLNLKAQFAIVFSGNFRNLIGDYSYTQHPHHAVTMASQVRCSTPEAQILRYPGGIPPTPGAPKKAMPPQDYNIFMWWRMRCLESDPAMSRGLWTEQERSTWAAREWGTLTDPEKASVVRHAKRVREAYLRMMDA